MKTVKIGRNTVEVYDSIDELPIKRFHKFNKYMLVDSGIGSDLNDINGHIARITKFIHTNKADALKELENLRQSLYMVSEETNIKHLSFAILIHKINGQEVYDISDDNIKRIMKRLADVKRGFLDGLIEAVKKKIDKELNLYFPGRFDDAALKDYFEKLKNKTWLQLDTIINGTNNTEKIDKIDSYLLTLSKPKAFSGKENAEIEYDKQFEEMCLFIQSELNINVDSINVLQFYTSFDFIKKKYKPNGRQSNKI